MMNEVGAQEELQCRMSPEEEDLISRLHNLLGDRWALIAGRIPGRTAEEVEMYWKWRMNCNNSRTEAANRGKYGPQEPQILKPVFSRLQSPRGWAKSKNGYSYKSHGSKSRDG